METTINSEEVNNYPARQEEEMARYEMAGPNGPNVVCVNSAYEQNEIMDAREQRSHIAIIQMAPPAQTKITNVSTRIDPVVDTSSNRGAAVKGSKNPGPSKRLKGAARGDSTPGKKKRHHCSVQGCTYNTPHTKDLARHMRKHTGEKPYNCDRCKKSFTRYDKLVMHIRIHEGHRPFSCQFCNYVTTDSSSLRKHLRTHTDERPYKCQYCSYASKDSSQLVVHLRHHTGDSPYVCVFEGCEAAFKTPSDLSRHTRLHTGEKPYKCLYCNYRAAVKSNLNVHMKRHTNPKPKNGRKGVERVIEEDDIEEMDDEPDKSSSIPIQSDPDSLPFQYACKLCDHKADTIELFTIHMDKCHPISSSKSSSGYNRSTKGRPPKKVKDFAEDQRSFQCSYCNAAFKCDNSLQCHMRQHGSVPNKPANVNPELYMPSQKIPAAPTHSSGQESFNTNHPIVVESNEPEREDSYRLHELQRMQVVQSVITENPSVINSNGAQTPGTFIQQHYDPATGHLYVVSYVNENNQRQVNAYHHHPT